MYSIGGLREWDFSVASASVFWDNGKRSGKVGASRVNVSKNDRQGEVFPMRATGLTSAVASALFVVLTAGLLVPVAAQPVAEPEQEKAPVGLTERMHAQCIRVVSGDRIEAQIRGDRVLRIQYLGVQLPASDDPSPRLRVLNRKALAFNRQLVENKSISLEFESTEPDEAGRLAAYVFVEKTFVNAELIRQGYARVAEASPEFQLKGYFQKQEEKAFEEGLGIWAVQAEAPVQPEVRRQPPSLPAGKYLASKQSKVFHYRDCQWAERIVPGNRLFFDSREEAVASGRRPCKICAP